MKQDCLLCERSSPDNNLYCQEVYCPAELSPTILDHGEWLGNIEIVKPIVVLRSSVLYEARYQKEKVLLKVAHPGAHNRERLKREAEFLQSIRSTKRPVPHLPHLLPPYGNVPESYGRVVLRGHLLYYCLYTHFDGEPLRDILTKNVQLWVYHIGWLMISLASTVAYLQSKGMFHFGISPDTVLVRLDDETDAPVILLFDLGIASDRHDLDRRWHPFFARPAYTAPELIDAPPQPTYATDVYGLGLTLYEMLIGEPPFPYKLLSDEQVYASVRSSRPVEMTREADVQSAANIAVKAVKREIRERYDNAAEMLTELRKAFGDVPEPRRRLNLQLTLLVVGAVAAVAILVLVQALRDV